MQSVSDFGGKILDVNNFQRKKEKKNTYRKVRGQKTNVKLSGLRTCMRRVGGAPSGQHKFAFKSYISTYVAG